MMPLFDKFLQNDFADKAGAAGYCYVHHQFLLYQIRLDCG
jgi:hypothetical protein